MASLAVGRQLPRSLPLPLATTATAVAATTPICAHVMPTPVPLSDYDRRQSARVVLGARTRSWGEQDHTQAVRGQAEERRAALYGRLLPEPTRTRTERWRALGEPPARWQPTQGSEMVRFFNPDCRATPPLDGFVWFDQQGPVSGEGRDQKPPRDVNRANLGKTLRILQDRLPTVLQSPLPHGILSPLISLHLFPSTHPHLPTVSGRVAYNAALWTSPIAWNRVPLVGNVRVAVVSERVTREPLPFAAPRRAGAVPEQLVVRWRTLDKGEEEQPVGSENSKRGQVGREFTGLFIFQFDEDGRILSHTIEHAQTGSGWESGVGAKVVGLTDWLLGGLKREGQPSGV